MKFYNSIGPNPHVVRMYASELGINLDMEDVDLMAGDNRKEPYLSKNPSGQLPCLETDSGEFISEITAICEYLDDITDGKTLMGNTAEERAQTRMWTRRVDLNICETMANGFRYSDGLPLFKSRMTTIPEAAEGLKGLAQEKMTWLDGQMGDSEFIGGSKISLADVLLYCFVAFGATIGQPLSGDLKKLSAWNERMSSRASASA